MSRLAGADLLGDGGPDAVRAEGFVVGAVDGLRGDHALELAEADRALFDSMVAGVDLAVSVVGFVLPVAGAAGVAVKAWGPTSAAGGVVGLPSPSELLLMPWSPPSPHSVAARREAAEGLADARLKGVVTTIAFAQATASGRLDGLPTPPAVSATPSASVVSVAGATRP